MAALAQPLKDQLSTAGAAVALELGAQPGEFTRCPWSSSSSAGEDSGETRFCLGPSRSLLPETSITPCPRRGRGSAGVVWERCSSWRSGWSLAESIDRRLKVLKRHLPYHESDHVLSQVYNVVSGGVCLRDAEAKRQDGNYRRAVGASRLPAPALRGTSCGGSHAGMWRLFRGRSTKHA